MHKNLQFCDICGHVVVEKLLFTSTYWECDNCEEAKKHEREFIVDTFATETIVAKLEPGEKIVIKQNFQDLLRSMQGTRTGRFQCTDGSPENFLWRSLRISQYRKPVVSNMSSFAGQPTGKLFHTVDIYEPTGRVRDNGEQYEYEYQFIRRETF